MRKSVKFLTAAIVMVMAGATLFGCTKDPDLVTAENPFGLAGMEVKPDAAALTPYDVNVTGQDAIDLAVELYQLACENDKNAACRAAYTLCHTSNVASGMDNKILLNILEIKNGNEYYRVDYRLKEDIPLFNALPQLESAINDSIELVTTERRYANTDMETIKYERVRNATTDSSGAPYADWTKEIFPEDKEMIVFASSQEGSARFTDHTIATDTVSEAAVTYDEIAGYYTVTMTLDCTNPKTTEITRPYIQVGSGADNAAYQTITVEFQIWDNGYMKYFDTNEYWTAQLNFGIKINVSSTFPYHAVYSYDLADCDISTYYTDGDFVDDYREE